MTVKVLVSVLKALLMTPVIEYFDTAMSQLPLAPDAKWENRYYRNTRNVVRLQGKKTKNPALKDAVEGKTAIKYSDSTV